MSEYLILIYGDESGYANHEEAVLLSENDVERGFLAARLSQLDAGRRGP